MIAQAKLEPINYIFSEGERQETLKTSKLFVISDQIGSFEVSRESEGGKGHAKTAYKGEHQSESVVIVNPSKT